MTRSRVGIVAGLLLAAGLAAFAVRESVRVWRVQQEVRAIEHDVTTMSARQKQLAEQAERLRSDPSSIEKLAREEMGMVREGETVLKFPSPK
jgi:cell division protein FtsB